MGSLTVRAAPQGNNALLGGLFEIPLDVSSHVVI
jgi:hypothetical protein